MSNNDFLYPVAELGGLLDKLTINFENFSIAKFEEKSLLEDLQANILKHHRRVFSCHIFIKFKKESVLKDVLVWLNKLSLTSAYKQLQQRQEGSHEEAIQCFYLAPSGYSYLNAAHLAPRKCPSFYKGLREDVITSFDNQKSKPFFNGNRKVDYDAMLLIADNNLEKLNSIVSEKANEIDSFASWQKQYGFLKESEMNNKAYLTEWFGFKEGISGAKYFPKGDKPLKEKDIARLRTLLIKDRGGKYEQSAGSYLVFLKMRQDYDAFTSLRSEIMKGITKPEGKLGSYREELAEAYIVGRFTDGTPVTLQDEESNKEYPDEDFDYKELLNKQNSNQQQSDSLGVRCPYHAHIRKVNERGENNLYENIKIHRRGMLYAEDGDLENAQSEARTKYLKKNKEVGVLFMAYQSSIEKQFEYLVRGKLHQDKFLENGNKVGKDILTSKGGDVYCFPKLWNESASGENLFSVHNTNSLSQLMGGIYLFAPSLSFFENLVEENLDVFQPVSDKSKSLETPNAIKLKNKVVSVKDGAFHLDKDLEKSDKITFNRHPQKFKNPIA